MSEKKVFISYSHSDQDFARRLASGLNDLGIDVWWDKWDLEPGDSLVQKIFESGLSTASHFLILLTPESTKSKWVKDELDIATVRRIEKLTKVIPVLVKETEIPAPLRALVWVDMRENFDEGIKRIGNVIQEISSRPPRGMPSPMSSVVPVGRLSRAATAVGNLLVDSAASEDTSKIAFSGDDLRRALNVEPNVLSDAVDELEDAGLIRVFRALNSAPYRFIQIESTYVLFREFKSRLSYDPDADVKSVAAAICARSQIQGKELQDITKLTPSRINRAVDYLDDYGLADVGHAFGTMPFSFSRISATYRTRQLAEAEG